MDIRRIMLMAAMMPCVGFASEVKGSMGGMTESQDTVFTVNNRNIVVSQDDCQTSVKVYKNDGKEMTLTSETKFVDGQEVERVFVTSPFIPQNYSKRKLSLQSHFPSLYIGSSMLPGGVGGLGGNSEMHSRDSRSWEWGISLTSLCLRLVNDFALTASLTVGQVHNHFQDNYTLSTTDGKSSMTQKEGVTLKKSYISYNVLRLPIMAEWQKRIGKNDLYVALGPSVEYRWNDHSRYFVGKSKNTETGDINLNPIGLNIDFFVGYGCVLVYARSGVTPLLKKSKAPECYPMSVGLGFRI